MYRIQPTTLSVAPHFRRGLTTLGVSWLRGQFAAVALHRGEIAGTWQAPEPVEQVEKIADCLRQAVQQTGFQGSTVHFVLAHAKLTHQLVDIPEARGSALRGLVQRQVEKLKVFDEPAAWTFEKAETAKNSASALVHLLPRTILYGLGGEVEKAGLHLVSAIPTTSILHSQFGRLPLANSEVGLLVADIAGSTTLVVARREGPLFLARSLDASRARGPAALAVDLNRTLLFVNQQFGVNVKGAWLFGPSLTEGIGELRPQIQVPIEPSPEEYTPLYWAQESLRIAPELTANLVSAQQIRAPQRRALLKLTTVLAIVAVTTMVAAAGWFYLRARHEGKLIDNLRIQAAQLQSEHQSLQRDFLELANRERFVRQILQDRPGPIPIWFLAYLGEITPSQLTVTNLQVRRETNAWRVRISGMLQPQIAPSASALLRAAAELSEKLRTGPFQARILPPAEEKLRPKPQRVKSATSAFSDWASRIRPPAPEPPPAPPNHFTVEALLP